MKVNGRDVIRAIITLVLLGEVVSVVLNYPVWRLLPRFAEATVGGIVLLSILLLPIIWSKSLRRNIALNAVVFLSMFTLAAIAEWQAFGRRPISYVFGVLWFGIAISYIFDIRHRSRKEKARVLSEAAPPQRAGQMGESE
jgi:4-hydroxybenzoate polyprenyltransferase